MFVFKTNPSPPNHFAPTPHEILWPGTHGCCPLQSDGLSSFHFSSDSVAAPLACFIVLAPFDAKSLMRILIDVLFCNGGGVYFKSLQFIAHVIVHFHVFVKSLYLLKSINHASGQPGDVRKT